MRGESYIIFKSNAKASFASVATVADAATNAIYLSGLSNSRSIKSRCGFGPLRISRPAAIWKVVGPALRPKSRLTDEVHQVTLP